MQLGYTIIYVNDVVATVNFYQQAFLLELKFLHESNQYAEMQTGTTTLAFAAESMIESNGMQFKPNRSNAVAAGFEIAFVTDDVNSAFATAIEAGAKLVSAPIEKPWDQTVAYVTDMNGVLVEICSTIT